MVERGLVFGEVAELYDAARAGYPDDLIDDVVDFAALRPGDRVLEVGAGTGIATRGFATRGLAIHVVEPSEQMAEVLRARTIGLPVTVDSCRFEEWSTTDAYPLLISAQAWHWVDPATKYRSAAAALTPSGAIAIFGHRPRVGGPLREPIEELQNAHVPKVARRPYQDVDAYGAEFVPELVAAGFTSVEHRVYRFSHSYSTDGYLQLMGTMSDSRMLPPERRSRLAAELADLIEARGGHVTVEYRTDLYLARAPIPA